MSAMRRLPLLKFLIAFLLCARHGICARTVADARRALERHTHAFRLDHRRVGQSLRSHAERRRRAGGSVTITSSGSELHLSGAGRDFSTTECWEQFPGLSRVSHSGGLRGWRSTCKTKAGDPRQATIVTTISATDNQISFDETGQYQFIITGQNCTASVRRTRSLSLVQREGESAPVAQRDAQPPSAPREPCAAHDTCSKSLHASWTAGTTRSAARAQAAAAR